MRTLFCLFLFALTSTLSFAQDCASWNDGGDSIKLRRYYEEYRKYLGQQNYDDVIYFWSYIYRNAPAATKNVYLDGVKIYKHLYENEENPIKKEEHLTKIIEIFDQRANCFQDDLPNILARKATQLKNLDADLEVVYPAFKNALDLAGNDIPSFALVPCAEITTQYYLEGGISDSEKDAVFSKIQTITATNIANKRNKHNYELAWNTVQKKFKEADIFPDNYGRLVKTEKDCYTITRSYKSKISQDDMNEALITKAVNELKNLDCEEASKYHISLLAKLEKITLDKIGNSDIAAKSASAIDRARFAVKQEKYSDALKYYREAINETTDISKKEDWTYKMAVIYYSKLDEKAKAKTTLLKVLEYNENSGKAYLLLGDIYYASAKECFPTDTFDQKMSVVAAIDKWKKAKSVDSSMASDANDRIRTYEGYTPTESEMFLARSRFKGKYYYLGCLINEKLKVK